MQFPVFEAKNRLVPAMPGFDRTPLVQDDTAAFASPNAPAEDCAP